EAEGAGPAGGVRALVGDLDDGDLTAAQRFGEQGRRAGDAGGAVAEAGAEALGMGQPGVAETGRAGEGLIAARAPAALKGLFDDDVRHEEGRTPEREVPQAFYLDTVLPPTPPDRSEVLAELGTQLFSRPVWGVHKSSPDRRRGFRCFLTLGPRGPLFPPQPT